MAFTPNVQGSRITGSLTGITSVSAVTITATTFYGNGANLTGIAGGFTGGTVSGATSFTGGLSANTFSATTYYGLPTDIRVTGGTYSNGTTVFTNNTGGTFSVSGFSTGGTSSSTFTGGTVSGPTNFTGGLTATTVSATTYLNLPIGSLGGSGTINYIPKWSGSTALGNSIIQDNGLSVGVGATPINTYKLYSYSPTGTSIYAVGSTVGIRGQASIGVQGDGSTYGVYGNGLNDLGTIGVYGSAGDNGGPFVTSVFIGGKFLANGTSGTNYGLQIQDGTEGINKVLISTTTSGTTNWTSTLTGLTAVSATTVYGNRVLINTGNTISINSPERLLVNDGGIGGTGYSNTIVGVANVNSYAQILMNNDYAGVKSSADIVAQADNGDENGNYIDMGINSSVWTGSSADNSQANDAYLFSTGNNLWVGNYTPNKYIYIHTDGGLSGNTRIEISSATTKINNTFVISSTPVNNDSNTQILTRNSSTGNIEYTSMSAITGTFNYGLAFAMSNSYIYM